MAFVFDPKKDKDKNQANQSGQQPGQATTLTQGQGSVIASNPNAQASPGSQKASSSGRFSNIQQYVKANDAGQLAGQFTGKIGEQKQKAAGQLTEAKSTVDKSTQAVGQAVSEARNRLQGAQAGLQGAYTAQGGPVGEEAFKQNLEGFKQGLGLQYQGVEDLGDQANLRAQAQNLQEMGQATQTAGGRSALLQRFFGNPQYAGGQRTLDTLLLGSQRPRLQQAGVQAATFGGELDTARRQALSQIAQARAGVTGTQEEARKAVEGQIGEAKGAIQQRAAEAQAIRDLLRKPDSEVQVTADQVPSITGDRRSDLALQRAMQAGFIDQSQVDAFKNLQGRLTNVGFNTRDVLARSLLQGEETGEQLAARAASQQQANRLGQLQSLIGQQSAYNPYQYDANAAEQMVADRENALVNALRSGNFDFALPADRSAQDIVKQAAGLGLIAGGMPAQAFAGYNLVPGAQEGVGMLSGAANASPLLKYANAQAFQAAQAQKAAEAASKIGGKIGGAVSGALGGIAKRFCFAPDTLVAMSDGTYKQIQEVKLGDNMLQGGIVYSLGTHLVDESQVYDYNGIIVTANHAVEENGKWLRVKNSKKAKHVPGATSVVYSVSNTGHRIVTKTAVFADHDEVDNSENLSEAQCLVLLNRSK